MKKNRPSKEGRRRGEEELSTHSPEDQSFWSVLLLMSHIWVMSSSELERPFLGSGWWLSMQPHMWRSCMSFMTSEAVGHGWEHSSLLSHFSFRFVCRLPWKMYGLLGLVYIRIVFPLLCFFVSFLGKGNSPWYPHIYITCICRASIHSNKKSHPHGVNILLKEPNIGQIK